MKSRKIKGYSKRLKITAALLLITMAGQMLYPNVAIALTTGPNQPEVQGFEPVGTTDMVDMFSGSFVYNIPLLDVEGYPVNISYHGGVTMEQEASWVGLGWNINPGVINRTVRGVPDDFNGDQIMKDLHIKPEKTLRVGTGFGLEFAGVGGPNLKKAKLSISLSVGSNINISNYKGVSCDFSFSGGVNVFKCVSAGVNLGIGSQTGASIDHNAGLSLASSLLMSKEQAASATGGGGLNVGIGGGYSTRSGIKDISLSYGISGSGAYSSKNGRTQASYKGSISGGATIPIGLKNYVPVITNSSTMNSIYGRVKLGYETYSVYWNWNVSAMFSKLEYSNDGTRNAFGYMYLQNTNDTDDKSILDFTRDKDGMFNKTMQYLPVPAMTYDIYNVSGQGTGGMFRPFRNDFGNVYDPLTQSKASNVSVQAEAGIGNLFEAGADITNSGTEVTSGPWREYQRTGTPRGYCKNPNGSIYENVYLKQGGEMTLVDPNYFTAIGEEKPILPKDYMKLPNIKPGSNTKRDPRANLIYYHTAKEASESGVGSNPDIINYTDPTFTTYPDPKTETINRIGAGPFQRKKDQLSEIVQLQKDGRKYVYGIPALNNVQREVTFTVDGGNPVQLAEGTVGFAASDATHNNHRGVDNYYSSTVTPSYAHSYLLTSVLSQDYVDVTGDGVSDDDLGSFTKFNYTRTDSDYRWVSPYSKSIDTGIYNPGFWSDKQDDKASFVCGSREQWYLHSIESKNYIAEFYTSKRADAIGITYPILNNGEDSVLNDKKLSESYSYKLDSIKLYNKHDRIINGANAIPIKTTLFVYDYSLCPNVPNTLDVGKLTLQRIYFRYGNSDKSMTSPYQFKYGSNFPYSVANKDRWGNYKPSNPTFTNYEFPYVDQNDPANNSYAEAWSLIAIQLPSGGEIEAEYESNDYAFVQDKPVNEMYMVEGLGNGPNFDQNQQLFVNNHTPYLFTYFKRRIADELPSLSFAQNYLGMQYTPGGTNCTYFNFHVALTDADKTFEQIKGYANVTDIGICGNDSRYGYIKFAAVNPAGIEGHLHPVTFTALNTGRYNLPQVVFPGQDPDQSNLMGILSGLKGAIEELLTVGRNPIMNLISRGGGKKVKLEKSYIRLQSVGLKKKGAGQRVKALIFNDNWSNLAGGSSQPAKYGKEYVYAKEDGVYGRISTGVASYEPMVGGDENPFRQPVKYTVQSGSKFPPVDPVDLYQETPIGESLFPSAQVGYSSVTVKSIHQLVGRSSASLDQYEFYTARDFPVQVFATSPGTRTSNQFDFFSQRNFFQAVQGYTLIFNDMHGKPKKIEHDKYDVVTGKIVPISYQVFNYKKDRNKLDNKVKCLMYNGTDMVVREEQLGIEEDITMDSRCKNELTRNSTFNLNLNVFLLWAVPVPIPYGFPWTNEAENEFKSAVVTKVIQQYGILDNIVAFNNDAVTTMHNEIFDPMTGQPVVTSITNEFLDKEYTTNIPASWVYKGMSNAFTNINYKDAGLIIVGAHHGGTLLISNTAPLLEGDELSIHYKDASGGEQHTTGWVMGTRPIYSNSGAVTCSGLMVLPRFPLNTPGWNIGDSLKDVTIRVINSGHKNRLDDVVETFTSMDSMGSPTTARNKLIDIKARTFSDSNTRIVYNYLANPDTVNPYAIGERGQWRLLSEYTYHANRTYAGTTARNSGLYDATTMFIPSSGVPPPSCVPSPYNYLAFNFYDSNWHATRTVTKWSPYGQELENVDAVGNYSTAVFGFRESLPVAVAANAKQGDILTLSFEDYNLLKPVSDIGNYEYFFGYNDVEPIPGSSVRYNMTARPPYVISGNAHTGHNAAYFPSQNFVGYFSVPMPMAITYGGVINNYNNYFPNSPTGSYQFSPGNEYLPFRLVPGKKYILSYWVYQKNKTNPNRVDYTIDPHCGVMVDGITFYPTIKKTGIIEDWMQLETTFYLSPFSTTTTISLVAEYYVDDLRIFPADANMKAFVYGLRSKGSGVMAEKLMATLDENNFATMYEYDVEGNLVRTKKETSKGIMTISESRSGNPAK